MSASRRRRAQSSAEAPTGSTAAARDLGAKRKSGGPLGDFRLSLEGGARTIDGMRGGRGKRVATCAGVLALPLLGLATWLSWPHLRFWWLLEPLGMNSSGYLEYRHRKAGIVFVALPAGTYSMGSQADDPLAPNFDRDAQDRERPVHEVTLSPFAIAKHEVKQAEWKRVMGNDPSRFVEDDLPVEQVSWDDCREFCDKTGLRLPTEAQWEYACRARTPGGYAGSGRLDDMGWYSERRMPATHSGGGKLPNNFQLRDMHGNVAEWCEDVYDEAFYSKPAASRLNPVCTSGSADRVFRGGSWDDNSTACRSAFRRGEASSNRNSTIGLRPVYYPLP
jgi:formylglycine-generating enzyme required for sulfatase activity